MKISMLLTVITFCVVGPACPVHADFNFDLDFVGNGKVTKQSPAPVQIFTADTNNISVTGSVATLVASGRSISPGNISDQSLQVGNGLNIALTNLVQGTKFDQWSGDGIPNVIGDPTPFNPTLNYNAVAGGLGNPKLVVAFSNLTINSTVGFSVNGNLINGTLSGSNAMLTWAALSPYLKPVGQKNDITLTLSDSQGSGSSEFDLDVFSPSSVPEPTSFMLLGGVLGAGLLTRRRLRRKG